MLFFLIFAIITLGFYPLIAYLIQSIRRKEAKSPVQILDAEFLKENKRDEAEEWWANKRSDFNRALLFIALLSAISMLVFLQLLNAFYLSLWQLFIGFTIYLIYMGSANLVFSVGLSIEKIQSPNPLDAFRQKTYSLLFWTANAIPIIFTLLIIIKWYFQY